MKFDLYCRQNCIVPCRQKLTNDSGAKIRILSKKKVPKSERQTFSLADKCGHWWAEISLHWMWVFLLHFTAQKSERFFPSLLYKYFYYMKCWLWSYAPIKRIGQEDRLICHKLIVSTAGGSNSIVYKRSRTPHISQMTAIFSPFQVGSSLKLYCLDMASDV